MYPVCGGHSLLNETNDNGNQMVNFALERDLALMGTVINIKAFTRSPGCHLDNKICNWVGHILVERRQCMKVCDSRSMRGPEIESDHFLESTKIRLQIKKSEKIKRSEISGILVN